MEKIGSDDLLLKILSFLPTKIAVSTSVLSKRWEFLWMRLPKLEYDDSILPNGGTDLLWECQKIRRFINRNMSSHRAPVMESLRLSFRTAPFQPEDINFWVANAVFRCVRELSINYFFNLYDKPNAFLPSSLYICQSLVALTLEGRILVDVPRIAGLPSLKIMLLRCVTFRFQVYFERLLFNCPVLEDLVLEECDRDFLDELRVISLSLRRLTLKININCYYIGFVINTPTLEYFKVTDYYVYLGDDDDDGYVPSYFIEIENMPKLEEAYIDSCFPNIDYFIKKFITPLTSIKRFSICLAFVGEKDIYGDGIAFNQLEHLKLYICQTNWSNLLPRLLKDSPNLLELEIYDSHGDYGLGEYLSDNCVPQCLLWSLQTFKWESFGGSKNEIELVKYILRNACCLKTATILGLSFLDPKKKLEVMEELSLSSRGSTSCQLEFFARS